MEVWSKELQDQIIMLSGRIQRRPVIAIGLENSNPLFREN